MVAALSNYCPPRADVRKFIVLIDAGHGGRDSGAPAVGRRRSEKEINLAVALLVAANLAGSGQITTIMTRTNDRYLSLIDRRRFIARCRPDLVVSIHADSGPKNVRGSSVYVLNGEGEAIVVNRMWNKSRSQDGDELGYIMADLAQRGAINWSTYVATLIQSKLSSQQKASYQPKLANFALLKAPGVPSILVETGYVSNRNDLEMLLSPAGQRTVAKAISSSIIKAVVTYKLAR